jgi:hypothetical protein
MKKGARCSHPGNPAAIFYKWKYFFFVAVSLNGNEFGLAESQVQSSRPIND